MNCGQYKCSNRAEYRYVWPRDGSEHDVCEGCFAAVMRLSMALGVSIRLTRIDDIEAKKQVLLAAFAWWANQDDQDTCDRLRAAVERLIAEEAKTVATRLAAAEPVAKGGV